MVEHIETVEPEAAQGTLELDSALDQATAFGQDLLTQGEIFLISMFRPWNLCPIVVAGPARSLPRRSSSSFLPSPETEPVAHE